MRDDPIPGLGSASWAERCIRCQKHVDEDENRTIDFLPALLAWDAVGGDEEVDPVGVICPSCQGIEYDPWSGEEAEE